ncbi:replication factor C large subunit [Candidatus Woesearchaeota archaeon]|nr:replication factor C large subunit [Candidatus Woesearchaeota archaeon]
MAERTKPWTQQHSPKKIKDIAGQDKAIAELKRFVVNFRKEKKKAAIIHGPTGSGKTCAVYAIANELGLEIVELNASDFRNAEGISSIVGNASRQMSLFFKGKIILVDEIDGVSGTQDRGGIPELARMIEGTAFPIVMTANDPFDKKFSDLRKRAAMIEFSPLQYTDVFEALKRIAALEKIKYEEDALKSIARRVGGDARAAVNDLQMLSSGGTLTKNDLNALSDREKTEEISTALTKVFKTTDPAIARQSFDTVSEDLKECMLWVDENLPKEYEKPADLARAYDFVSKADIMNRRIMRWQHWRFLVYINDYLSAGVAVSKDEKYRKIVDYGQTQRLLKIYIANRKYQKRLAICEKIAAATHSSKKEVVKDTYPYIKEIFRKGKDREMISAIADKLDLDSEEIDYLRR